MPCAVGSVCPPFFAHAVERRTAAASDDVERTPASGQIVTSADNRVVFNLMGSLIVVVVSAEEEVDPILVALSRSPSPLSQRQEVAQ